MSGVQILPLDDQILQPPSSHICYPPPWRYVRSVTSVSHVGSMITGNSQRCSKLAPSSGFKSFIFIDCTFVALVTFFLIGYHVDTCG